MDSGTESFPFPALPPGEITPAPGPGDIQELLRRDAAIIRWFIEKRWNRRLRTGSTLEQLVAASEAVDLHGAVSTMADLDKETARHGLHLTSVVIRLAWAVRALHGAGGSIDRVDGSFIDDELLGEDTKERGAERKLPAGIGTIVFAARLVQAGQGRIVSINGHRGVGHDIRWTTGLGDTVYIERKDRSYEAGLRDTQEKRIARVVEETRKAGLAMPREQGAVRVLVVGFQHLVRKNEARCVDRGYFDALRREFGGGRVRHADLPNIVVAEHLGLEPKAGGAKFDFFSPQGLVMKPKELVRRVGRSLVKGLGARLG